MSIQKKRVKASNLAQSSSNAFCESYGHSPLESIAPFERDEIILGRRVGSGTFSSVYEIRQFNLRSDQSKLYTEEQIAKREATVDSMKNGAKYVIKCLKDKLEDADDEDRFLCAAQDIVHEAEMLAALSHPNIITLQGVVASRHKAFLDGASQFFIILERLDCTLADKVESWTKENRAFNPSASFRRRLIISNIDSSGSGTSIEKGDSTNKTASKGAPSSTLHSRLRVAASLADAVEYLHSKGVIFRDLKPDNVGFDRKNQLKLFDFGLARFMPKYGDSYEDVFQMSNTGTPRYTAAEVIFQQPYNLKSDVYSLSVVVWEILSLKKPFAKYKHREDLEKALMKVDFRPLSISQRWSQSVQDIVEKCLSRDLWARPKMSEVCTTLNECVSMGAEACESVNKRGLTDSTSNVGLSRSMRLPSRRVSQKLRSSFNGFERKQLNRQISLSISETSATTADTIAEEFFLHDSLHALR